MRRVSVVGSSGSGKSTMAQSISASIGVPWIELDAINHQADWVPLPPDEFQEKTRVEADRDAWVIDGNYDGAGVQGIVWARADTVVWIDLPKAVVMRRLLGRSLRRSITREELWNGNRENLLSFFKTEPEENLLLWAWTRFDANRERYLAAMVDPRWSSIRFIHLHGQPEVDKFVKALD